MKILIYSENEYGCGASIVAWLLAEEYVRKGHQIEFLYRNPRKNAPKVGGILKTQLSIDNANFSEKLVYFFWFFWSACFAALAKLTPIAALKNYFIHLRRYFKYKKNVGFFEKLVERKNTAIQPDAIHLHDVLTFMRFGFIDKMSQQYQTIWTFHNCFAVKGYTTQFKDLEGEITESYPDLTFKEMSLAEQKRLFSQNKKIQYVTPSKWLHDLIRAEFTFPENLHVIHNGLSPTEFQQQDKLAARHRLGLEAGKKYALAIVGELHLKHKNFRQLKNAFDKINDANIQLIAIGNRGKWTEPFPKNIAYQGAVYDNDKKNDYFSAADVFVIPSLADNFPTVILESMICGTPVLGSAIGGIPELVKPQITGQLFNPYDADDLIFQLKSLLENEAHLQTMGENCRTIAVENFTLEHIAAQYLQLI